MAYFRAFCKVGIIVRSLAESSVLLYGNISTFRSDWREIEYRRIAVGFRLWIRCQRLWHQDCCQSRPQFKPFDTKDFIALFGALLRMRNLLVSFDEFAGKEMISERDLQDYLGKYQDLRDEWKRKRENGESTDIIDDIVFEVELIKQIEINIDYILMLVKKYHDTHCEDKEVLITIHKAIDASPELRSKKQLIENFIAGINDVDDVMTEWNGYVAEQREADLEAIIKDEKLKPEETRKFLENSFREGEVKTVGTDIDTIMPPVSRFGGGNRAKKKQTVIDKLKTFFEKYFGIGGPVKFINTEDGNQSDI